MLVVLVAGIDLFWSGVFQAAGLGGMLLDAALGLDADPWSGLIGFFLSPLIGLLMIAVSAGVTHLLLLVLGGAGGGVRTTLAVYAYAYSPQIFHAVPVLGTVVAAVWSLVLLILGLREAHATDGWRTALAVLVPLAGLMTLLFLGALLVALAGTELGL